VVPYLTLVGLLAQEARSIDLDYAFHQLERSAVKAVGAENAAATQKVFDLKETLVERPIRALFHEPHHLSAWLSQHRLDATIDRDGRVVWARNPIEILAETYRLLHLDTAEEAAADRIWDHDRDMLEMALGFYTKLADRVPAHIAWPVLDETLRGAEPSFGFDAATWERVRAAHAGHQLALGILGVLPLIGARAGFDDLALRDDLSIAIPERLLDVALQDAMRKVLVPPPTGQADQIVAPMGGMFYATEAPHLPHYVDFGQHFEKGDPLFIIEVMKMFNKIYAPFSGTITGLLVQENGVIVRKGQPIFRVTPDEQIVEEDPTARAQRIRKSTDEYLAKLSG
jgi:biotin carboxyl carrier protein